MTQTFARYCPRCGTPTREKARVCLTCGLPAAAMRRRSSNAQEDQQNEECVTQTTPPESTHSIPLSQQMQQEDPPQCSPLPYVPPSGPALEIPLSPSYAPIEPIYENVANQPDTQIEQISTCLTSIQLSPLSSLPAEPIQLSPLPLAALVEPKLSVVRQLAQHIQGKRRSVVLLAVLFICSVGGYLAFLGLHRSQAPIKSVNVHIPFTYAGMNIVLFKVQQAQNFVDDPNTVNDGMVRLYFQEQNTTTSLIAWDYTQSARLLIQGQPALVPIYVQSKDKIAPSVTQTSVLDFAVPNGGSLSHMTLQLGSASEAQLLLPLTGQADLSQYQPQTRPQHGNMAYFGLNLTLTSSTTSLSIPNKQAVNGMEYLTFTMTIDNMLSQQIIIGSSFDYARLKIDGKMFTPVSTTLPVSFTSNQIGNVGAITFLVPQNSASGTFLLVSQDSSGNGQASTDFVLSHANKV